MINTMLSRAYRLQLCYLLWRNTRKTQAQHRRILRHSIATGLLMALILTLPGEQTIALLEMTA